MSLELAIAFGVVNCGEVILYRHDLAHVHEELGCTAAPLLAMNSSGGS